MKYLCILFAAFCLPYCFAQTVPAVNERLEQFLDAENVQELVTAGSLTRSVYGSEDMKPQLVPPFPVNTVLAGVWQHDDPSCMIESLYLYKKPQGDSVDVKRITDVLYALSNLEGLQYYSSSRRKMRTLYEKSYPINNPSEKKRIADPIGRTDKAFSLYVLQKDLSFGENIYQFRFFSDEQTAGFASSNTGTLKYSIFKAVEPEQLLISVAVTDIGEYLLIHSLTRVRFAALPMLRDRIQNSFRTRGEAVYKWFIENYENSFSPAEVLKED